MSTKIVFVYGTLKEDEPKVPVEGNRLNIKCALLQGFMMEGHAGFPGVKPGAPKDGVFGQLIEYDEDEILNRLDRIEGYTPGGNNTFYDRRMVAVRTPNGDTVEAFVYIYMGDAMESGDKCRLIEVKEVNDLKTYNWVGNVKAW